MTDHRLLYLAVGVLSVVSLGAIGIQDDGITFPDGSFQTTAGGSTAAQAVQGKTASLAIVGTGSCSE